MLDITKDMSKSIARMEAKMQDTWDQMIEVLDKQSNVILEIQCNFGNQRTIKSSRIP